MNEENNRRLNTKRLNQLVNWGTKIGKVLYILFIILLVYVVTLIFREWKILSFIGKIFSVISPLFIGWFIAWLLNPMTKKLLNKGLKRGFAVTIAYLTMILVVGLVLTFIIPSLGEQISDIVSSIPKIASDISGWIDNIFIKLSSLSLENLDTVRESFINKINLISTNIQTNLPETAVNIVSALASGIGKIIISLILGFYILFDFDKVSKGFIELFPKKSKDDVEYLITQLNDTLSGFINGTLWLSLLLFVVSVIGFSIIGLKAPVLIAFICVITNLIPYIGPYMGAAVAGAIGFTQSPIIGILTLAFILVVQIIDGEILNPIVMSKKLNLSPITIIISLLIFEYLFGIVGMVIATPVVAVLKIIYVFLDEKYNFFGFIDNEK
ncbi:MAG: AI-2E family transporter [Bacilli bacterium]|nr:AI-2E family transporter [Bacilli bacterium]